MTDSKRSKAPKVEEFHVAFECSPGLCPRNSEFRVSVIVSTKWLASLDLTRIPLVIGFFGGDVKDVFAVSEVRQTVCIEDLIDPDACDLDQIRSGTPEEKREFLLVLDRVLEKGTKVWFYAGDQEEHRITIPRDLRERQSHPPGMLLMTILFPEGKELEIHFTRKELEQYFLWNEDIPPLPCP